MSTSTTPKTDGVAGVLYSWMRSFGREFMVALLLGWFGELAYSIFSATDIARAGKTFCILWFSGAATFFIGAILGFLFGVPKSRTSPQNTQEATGYIDNNNLEEISDWVTKIVVGLSLVEFKRIAIGVGEAGLAIKDALDDAPGAYVVGISVLVYGFACGFLNYYVWARINLSTELLRQLAFRQGRAPGPD